MTFLLAIVAGDLFLVELFEVFLLLGLFSFGLLVDFVKSLLLWIGLLEVIVSR